MTKRPFSMDNFTESLISLSLYNKNFFDAEDTNHKKMVESLKKIVNGELTEKQKICILLYYGKMMKMKDISEKLGIDISCVSRHIKRAKIKIEKTMKYYF